jgi:hypothetical protein
MGMAPNVVAALPQVSNDHMWIEDGVVHAIAKKRHF